MKKAMIALIIFTTSCSWLKMPEEELPCEYESKTLSPGIQHPSGKPPMRQ
jgi:hypothetical protein